MQEKTEIDDELLMELADIGQPEKLASHIIRRRPQDVGPPVLVERIANALGISEINRVDTDSYEGMLITDSAKSAGIIAVRERSRRERQRFTIAHEIGHFVIPTHGRNAQCSLQQLQTKADTGGSKEAQANAFAACLLMPESLLNKAMKKWRDPDVSMVIELAERFEVSKEAMARRIMDITDQACAIVFSLNGMIRYPVKSKNFPWIDVKSGHPLPPRSATASRPYSQGGLIDWTEIGLEVWLEGDLRRRGEMHEQFVDLAGGHRMTMLSFDDEE